MKIEYISKLNKRTILATSIFGFILLGSLFAMNTIIEQAASAQSSSNNSTGTQMSNATNSSSDGMASTNRTNIILVHGAFADASGSWSKVIPILEKAGHRVLAVQLAEHTLADDVGTVKRAIALVGGPAILVGHSYGGEVITNAGYNNMNVKGLVYLAAFAPDEGQSLSTFVSPASFPKGLLVPDSAGFLYIDQAHFHDAFAQDVNSAEASVMAATQIPINQSIFAEKSGPPAWKQLPTWYQVSDNDRMIPPDTERQFAKQMNATTISLPASHSSLVSHPNEIANLILDAAKERGR
jgi:pimeloyl-ACP methyl ester carboxylesterase